jgi:endonuclease/exonuclease/phosphatase (EEP) superfamily protein YafD
MFLQQIERQSHSAAILLKSPTDGVAGPPERRDGRFPIRSSCDASSCNVVFIVGSRASGGGATSASDRGKQAARGTGSDRLKPLLFYGLGLLLLIATILPFHKDETWWVRACDFPRLQIATLTAITLAGILARTETNLLSSTLTFALLGCLGVQLRVILPYTPLWPVEVRRTGASPGPRTLSLVIVNVFMQNREVDRLKDIMRGQDPDLVLAVETDEWWCGHLKDALPHHPFRIAHPLPNTYGMMLLSRLELVDPEVRFVLKPDIPSIRTGVRLRSGDVIMLYGLHPEPPSPTEAATSLPRDAELVMAGREIAQADRPTLVAGDLNDVAWSHTSRLFRRVARMLDPRVGRGVYNTFHARYWFLRWPLDHVFVSNAFLLRRLERLPAFGSDHFPIYAALDHSPAAAAVQEAPAPDAEDRAEARDKLQRAAATEAGRPAQPSVDRPSPAPEPT